MLFVGNFHYDVIKDNKKLVKNTREKNMLNRKDFNIENKKDKQKQEYNFFFLVKGEFKRHDIDKVRFPRLKFHSLLEHIS